MPRLLLVDDNPSIHRIAESLLASTDVELVCVASAAEALDRLGRGERFDVALVDTAMPGMDGWTLLDRLRAMQETARMPIALMAGVLDPVDPAKLAKAPIQGFLQKPIELRELGVRVQDLLATPVAVAEPSPFSTVPATLAKDLLQRPEHSLPEPGPKPLVEPVAGHAPMAFDGGFPAVEEDLLVLDAEDLWPEETSLPGPEPATVEVPVEPPASILAPTDVQLELEELEELDFDTLQNLTDESLPTFDPIPEQPAFVPPSALMTQGLVTGALPESFLEVDLTPRDMEPEEIQPVTMSGLEELDAFPPDFQLPVPPAQVLTQGLDRDDADLLITASPATVAETGNAAPALAHPVHDVPTPAPQVEASPAPHAAFGQATAVPGQSVSSEQAKALVQALVADPVLVDALVKAVVARMGDQVLREIAWEVLPDLAGRLQR